MHNKIPRVQIYGMASEFLFRETEELFRILADLKYWIKAIEKRITYAHN